ncbi:MAG: GspE/PulE family protein [Candidatus Omnitrophica bacterium]|jgi:type II secretory ATPase GspE/PulE/Tfp pilus assembly ATPase PilB-like protein|nr:GspE/PulE family protein [Candidatus Omnitrophota bacterium]MDD3982685.1 GspE/PulE family protein [Candidatus Omnitrophota bacterium]MDD5526189.1 GspE/PulE family protein [Candidatus Omnitrophota bacterium]
MTKIGEFLVQRGLLNREQLERALKESRISGELIGKTLLRMKLVTQEKLLMALGEQLGIPYYPSLQQLDIPQEVIKAVSPKFIQHYKFMPVKLKGNVLTVAVSDPLAVWLLEDLKLHLGFDIERVLATQEEILAGIKRYYGVGADTVEEILTQEKTGKGKQSRYETLEEIQDIGDMGKTAEDASVIKLVNQILSESVNARATDIHLETFRDYVRVRYRIDGILYDMRVPEAIKHLHSAVVSRIKIISNLNVVEKRLPQDGRAIIKIQDRQVDLRISIIPSIYGENVVIRILPVQLLFNLDDLGFFPEDLKKIETMMQKPHGIIFVTGPTGSGKTTTLYACLSKLNKEAVKIITIEDPIEYELGGVMQIQIKPEIGFTFANALRSILRHDPDIMMVGEVRDLETAELAIRTSLTGHLIFSTLHTNDAASGATRLLDIGIEPYLVASSVNAFISQRLVRVICPACKEEVKDKGALPEEFRDMKIYRGKGCELCKFIGYKGRTAIHEIFFVDEKIRSLILNKASASQIKAKALELGATTLKKAGLEKVRLGQTTPEELLRVVEWGRE